VIMTKKICFPNSFVLTSIFLPHTTLPFPLHLQFSLIIRIPFNFYNSCHPSGSSSPHNHKKETITEISKARDLNLFNLRSSLFDIHNVVGSFVMGLNIWISTMSINALITNKTSGQFTSLASRRKCSANNTYLCSHPLPLYL